MPTVDPSLMAIEERCVCFSGGVALAGFSSELGILG
jgi:hypothetical protein